MPLIVANKISLRYANLTLLDNVSFNIKAKERIALIGRNGTGKTTLLHLLSQDIQADVGTVQMKTGLRIGRLSQDANETYQGTVYDVVVRGIAGVSQLLIEYFKVNHQIVQPHSDEQLHRLNQKLSQLVEEMEVQGAWHVKERVENILSRLNLPRHQMMQELSGGIQRRVLLAQALVCAPDLLLLDEPTNHLDIDGITWLEQFLLKYQGTLVFVSHDRKLIQTIATRIMELDRGQLTSWPGSFDEYNKQKEQQLEVEHIQKAKFSQRLAKEEEWIRQGIKARRTRNEGRVRALKALRQQQQQLRSRVGSVDFVLDIGNSSGEIIFDVEKLSKKLNDQDIVQSFTTKIMRGDRIGIVGPNGVGKTTLLKLLLGKMSPDTGSVRCGTRLQIAYFDQQRMQLDLEKTVIESLDVGKEYITLNNRSYHIRGYLKQFMFSDEQLRCKVKSLSGGERNRLLFARLFTRPSNLLVLDEPTNDLDIDTLEMLESMLVQYRGTLLLVSHDRVFLENVVTSMFVIEKEGVIKEYAGSAQMEMHTSKFSKESKKTKNSVNRSQSKQTDGSINKGTERKRNYKENHELLVLPKTIEKLECEQKELLLQLNKHDFYAKPKDIIAEVVNRVSEIEEALEQAYLRWEQLEKLRS